MRCKRTGWLLALTLAAVFWLRPGFAWAQISPGELSRAHQEFEGVRNCTRCHAGGSRSSDDKCLECHEGIAFLVEAGRGLHARRGDAACAECHPEHAGRDFELIEWKGGSSEDFDHTRTGWLLEGAHAKAKCRDCHQSDRQTRSITLRMQSKRPEESWLGLQPECMSCHVDVHQSKLGTKCGDCHSVTQWHGVEKFDHSKTGYALAGSHAKVECEKCHQNGRFVTSARADAKWALKGLATTNCASCHADVHKGRFGSDCARCHVVEGFRIVSSETFDHDRTRYPLRGAHRKVECARCHDEARGGWGAKPRFDRCGQCHSDPHAGTATLAGAVVDCEACHSVDTFRTSTFDVARHAATRYPLEGKHRSVECSKCHRPAQKAVDWGAAGVQMRPESDSCQDCHADAHAGQLVQEALRCDRCHSVEGFRPSTFDAAAHQQARFPLLGAHAKVACEACHRSQRPGLPALDRGALGKADFALRGVETECGQCHIDVHAARYGPDAPPNLRINCEECHSNRSFRPSKVDVALHQRFAFSLEGAHRATPCFLCHSNLTDSQLRSTLISGQDSGIRCDFTGVPTACEACHTKGVPR